MSKERSSCAKTGYYKSGISDLNTGLGFENSDRLKKAGIMGNMTLPLSPVMIKHIDSK